MNSCLRQYIFGTKAIESLCQNLAYLSETTCQIVKHEPLIDSQLVITEITSSLLRATDSAMIVYTWTREVLEGDGCPGG